MAARSEDTWKMTWGGGEGRGWVRGAGQMGRNLNKEHGSFFLFPFHCSDYESMLTHLQETWEIQNKVTYSSTVYYNYFLSR